MYRRLEPIDPREAFEVVPREDSESTTSAAASQAALLLAARAGVVGESDRLLDDVHSEGYEEFGLPALGPLERSHRMRVEEATRPLGMSQRELQSESAARVQVEMATAVRSLYEHPQTETAAALFEAGMQSPHLLVRVAAAAGARETTRLRKRIRAILEEGVNSGDPTIAELAQSALGKIDRRAPDLQRLVTDPPPSQRRDHTSGTAVLTHGTWGADQNWYKPLGDFHAALTANRPDLHAHDQSFMWSGGYSHTARTRAVRELEQWIADQGLDTPDFFAHSHGATVAGLATRAGVEFGRLVLLAWPVRMQWGPVPSNVARLIDVRVRLDLVILIDGGAQRFPAGHPKLEEHRHGWFDHAAVHDPDYWDDHDLWSKL